MELELPNLDNLPDESPREKLILLLKFVKNWSTFEGKGPKIALDFFMTWIGYLYLDYFQHHLEEAEACGREHFETLKAIKEPIEERYISRTCDHFDAMSDYRELVWGEMCELRTNVEAFEEMFGILTGKFLGFSMEDLRETMYACRATSSVLQDDEIPENVPESHWWWFFKDEYRETSRKRWERYFKQREEEES